MLPARLRRIVSLFARFPGIGEKSAARFVLYLLTSAPELARDLGAELLALHERVAPCGDCGNLAEVEPGSPPRCTVCADSRRDATTLCIVARVTDLFAIERAGAMRGRYFVLGHLLSPLEGTGPEDLPIPQIAARIARDGVREVIVATPPSVDGEATALLLKRELERPGVTLSRLASGIPHGGDLEFADPITMGRALSGRQKL